MRRFLPLLLLVTLSIAACDTTEGGTVFLAPRDVSFTYTVNFDNVTPGEQATVQANETVSLNGRLDGFQPSEIVAARVTAVRIERLSPITRTLGALLSSAQVSVGSQTVASGTIADIAREAPITVVSNSVEGALRSGFGSTLAFVPKAGISGDFRFQVTLTLAIEVEGL